MVADDSPQEGMPAGEAESRPKQARGRRTLQQHQGPGLCYSVYLEVAPDGLTMAHVSGLPGCIVRAPTREMALQKVPEAICRYQAWLRRHGEPAPPEAIEIEVAGESTGFGPFASGNAAALFPPDRPPITPQEMERYFRLMEHSRADLLALVGELPDETLDLHPSPHSRSIREILRHIGNAEEWYVSRLLPPERLPPEWESDENMPIFNFLEMERRTALECLRRLGEEERSGLFHPTWWTEHPEEPWTARKVLRRFLEHEAEHRDEIREVLAFQRRLLLARLAEARSTLLETLLYLDEKALTETPAVGEWTPKDLLAHIIAWDRWAREEVGRMVGGEELDLSAVADEDAFNAVAVAAWRDRSLEEVLAALQEERTAWVEWMKDLPEEGFFRQRPIGRYDWHLPGWIEVYVRHEERHAADLTEWKKAQAGATAGPKALLMAALSAGREELLTAAELVSPEERASRPVCGVWTLKDVLGHIADWEAYLLAGLLDMAAGRPPRVEHVPDEEAWNQTHAQARRDQLWETVWADFQGVHQALLKVLGGMGQADLERAFPDVWEKRTCPYFWFLPVLEHDREHARDLRQAFRGE